MTDPKSAGASRPVEAPTIDWNAVYELFATDRLVSRKELEWVRLKLRKYAAAPAPPAQSVEAQPQCENCETAIAGDWNFCPKCGLSFIPAPPADTPALTDAERRAYLIRIGTLPEPSDSPVIPDSSSLSTELDASQAIVRQMGLRMFVAEQELRKIALNHAEAARTGVTRALNAMNGDFTGCEGYRPAVADTPAVDKESLTTEPVDTREREWRVQSRHSSGCITGGGLPYLRNMAAVLHGDLQYSDDGGKSWVDADTPSAGEPK